MFAKLKIGHQQHCCYCDSQSALVIRGFTYSGIEHLVCEAHLNKLKAKISNDSDVARRMIDAHGIESITDVVSVKPEILKELLHIKENRQ
ncbi:MAG: hypothetical protein IKA48_00305 [Fibrobacter sp.]|nr:hypothetical protein [Fibrobacter sp.]